MPPATGFNPEFTYAYIERGAARNSKGEYDRATADYDQAIRLDRSRPEVRRTRERAQAALATLTVTLPPRSDGDR